MIGKSSSTTTQSFQKGFQTLNENLVRSNATLTQRLNDQQLEIDLLQAQVNALDTDTTGFTTVTKTSLGLDQVNNTSDANKPLSTATTNALATKHPLLEDATNKRLSQNLVQGLVTDLANKHPLITTTAKLSKSLVDSYYFSDIQTSSSDNTPLSTALVNIPSSSVITSGVGITPKVTLDTTLRTFQPKLENTDGKRLSSSLIATTVASTGVAEVTLDTTLAGKQNLLSTTNKLSTSFIDPLYISDIKKQSGSAATLQGELDAKHPSITTSAKLDKSLVTPLYFADIQTSASDTTTLASALQVVTPTVYVGGSSNVTTWSNLNYSVGSIISVRLTSANNTVNSSNQFTVTLLSTLPKGTWSGCAQFIFTKGSNYSFVNTSPIRIQIHFGGTKEAIDFFPGDNHHQASYVTRTDTTVWQMNLPVLFRCFAGRPDTVLQTYITVPNSTSILPMPNSGLITYTITLSLTKIAM